MRETTRSQQSATKHIPDTRFIWLARQAGPRRVKVVSVTVNYKTPNLTVRAIQSELADVSKLDGRIMLVDNDSQDGSFEFISEAVESRGWSERVTVIKAPRNGGFGFGNNFAIKASQP